MMNWLTMQDVAIDDNGIVDGPFGSNLKKSDYIDDSINGIPVLTTKNLYGDYSANSVRYISKEKYETLKRSTVFPGDILVAKIGSIGKCGIYPLNQGIALIPANLLKITLKPEIVRKYVYYYIQSSTFQSLIKSISTATAQPAFNVTKFRKLPIPVPSQKEQARIVARIEELFSQLESGVETLKQTKEQLAVYRLSVLKAAFEGRFTHAISDKTWRIIDFADVDTGATPLTSNPDYYNGEIAWVTSAKINDNEITTASDYITEKALKETNCKVFPAHTLLVAMYGEGKTRGKCAELMIPAATNQALAAIRIRETSEISLAYVKWFLTFNYQNIRRKAAGGVQPNLNLGIVKKIQVPQHTKEEQNRIVSEIESRLSVCDQIEQTVDAALQQAEALRQSILKKAFEGGL